MKSALLGICFIIGCFLVQGIAQADHTFKGATVCKMCHSKQYIKWQSVDHSKALSVLTGANATNAVCLKCHTTTTGSTESVGCERCHGAGSDYMKINVMKDYKTAVANGLNDLRTADGTAMDKDKAKTLCLQCHGTDHADNPNAKPFDFDAAWDKIKHDKASLN